MNKLYVETMKFQGKCGNNIYGKVSERTEKLFFTFFEMNMFCQQTSFHISFEKKHAILQNNFAKQFVFLGVEIWGPKTQIV